MSLKEQILKELREQNDFNLAEIKKCENDMSIENFTNPAHKGTSMTSYVSEAQIAESNKKQLKQENAWIRDMLNKYQ